MLVLSMAGNSKLQRYIGPSCHDTHRKFYGNSLIAPKVIWRGSIFLKIRKLRKKYKKFNELHFLASVELQRFWLVTTKRDWALLHLHGLYGVEMFKRKERDTKLSWPLLRDHFCIPTGGTDTNCENLQSTGSPCRDSNQAPLNAN